LQFEVEKWPDKNYIAGLVQAECGENDSKQDAGKKW